MFSLLKNAEKFYLSLVYTSYDFLFVQILFYISSASISESSLNIFAWNIYGNWMVFDNFVHAWLVNLFFFSCVIINISLYDINALYITLDYNALFAAIRLQL